MKATSAEKPPQLHSSGCPEEVFLPRRFRAGDSSGESREPRTCLASEFAFPSFLIQAIGCGIFAVKVHPVYNKRKDVTAEVIGYR